MSENNQPKLGNPGNLPMATLGGGQKVVLITFVILSVVFVSYPLVIFLSILLDIDLSKILFFLPNNLEENLLIGYFLPFVWMFSGLEYLIPSTRNKLFFIFRFLGITAGSYILGRFIIGFYMIITMLIFSAFFGGGGL